MIRKFKSWLSTERLWWRMRAQWRRARRLAHRIAQPSNSPTLQPFNPPKSLIIPCDPWAVVGSRGDQAMILSCVQQIRAAHPDRVIDIMTDDTSTNDECRAIGLTPIACWSEPIDAWFVARGGEYDEVYILGADVTDGVYGWPTACKLLAYYDLFASVGKSNNPTIQQSNNSPLVHYLGFSWSKTPNPMMRRVMRMLSPGLPLPIRDPVSYERVAQFSRHRPLVQVADAAFCLKPRVSDRVARHQSWVAAQHQAGKRVIALNVHTMFNEKETRSEDWERAFVAVLQRVLTAHPEVQLLFLPHDNRPQCSDYTILKRLYSSFDSARTYFADGKADIPLSTSTYSLAYKFNITL